MDAEHAVRKSAEQHTDPADAGSDPAPAGVEGQLDVEPGPGGYAGRDPKTEMPRVPSAPETQTDPGSHDAASDDDTERPPHE